MVNDNLWICVTGIDGCGKTTVCNYINSLLNDSKFMKIPYFDWVREMIKISGNNSPYEDRYTDALIFAAAHRLEMYYISSFLIEYKFLITQRSGIDSFPYGIAQGYSYENTTDILKPQGFESPDIIFFLKCDYKIAYERIKNQKGDKFEEKDLMKIHETEFEKMFNKIMIDKFPIKFTKTQIIPIDANKSLGYVKNEVRNELINLGLID